MELNKEHCIICLLSMLLICIFIKYNFFSKSSECIGCNTNYIKKSNIPESGNGVFASKHYKKGDIIEECHCLYDHSHLLSKSIINDYSWDESLNGQHIKYFPVTGNCNFINHSDNHNADTKIDIHNKKMHLIALKDIQKDDEIYINYGEGYWLSRKKNHV